MTKEQYGEKFHDHLLEQYKMYVEMMDRISARRGQTNSFYISLLSGLLAFPFLSLANNKELSFQYHENKAQVIALLAVGFLGIIFCFLWYVNIRSYRQLNSGKFNVISQMERDLPFACYDKEWEILDTRKNGYLQLTKVEKYVPFVLIIPYFSLVIYSIIGLLNLA